MHSNEAIKAIKLDTDLMMNSCNIIVIINCLWTICLFNQTAQHDTQILFNWLKVNNDERDLLNCLMFIWFV